MKKLLALILALAMCFSLVACGGDKKEDETAKPSGSQGGADPTPSATTVVPADPTVTYKDTVKISVAAERNIVGYYGSTSQPASYMGKMMMEGLFAYDYQKNETVPVIAKEAVDVNGDGKTWKVTINEGVTFNYNGEHYADLKASDVAFTHEFIKKGGEGQASGAVVRAITLTDYIESIDVNGDYELTFNLTSALFDFPAYAIAYIMSEKAIEEFGQVDGQDIGTGPYYYNTDETVVGQYWTMTRNDGYWGGIDNCPTKNIVFVLHSDANTGVAALQAGEVDARHSVSATDALQFEADPAYTVHSNTGVRQYFLGYNSYDGKGFFDGEDTEDQIKLRQAINYALDRDKIVSIVYAANPASGTRIDSFFGKETVGYVDQGQWEYDIEKARSLMEEIGYSETNRLSLIIACSGTGSNATYAEIIQDMLKDAYMDLEVKPIDSSQWGSFLRTGEGWDLFVNYYSTQSPMAYNMTNHAHSGGSGSKTQGWASAAVDEKIDNIMAQTTKDAQLKAFAEFQEWLHDYHPRLPTHAGKDMIAAKATVEGVFVCPDVAYQDFSTFRIPE